jgi:hypothetical protein
MSDELTQDQREALKAEAEGKNNVRLPEKWGLKSTGQAASMVDDSPQAREARLAAQATRRASLLSNLGLDASTGLTRAVRMASEASERQAAERLAAERLAAKLGPNHLFRYKPTDAYLKIDTNINGIFGNLINYLSKNDVKIVEQQLKLIRMLKEAKEPEAEAARQVEEADNDEESTMEQVD